MTRAAAAWRAAAWRASVWICFGLSLVTTAQGEVSWRLGAPPSPPSLPYYVAEEQGFFAAEGVSVNVSTCEGGYGCLADVTSGKVDLAGVPNMPLVMKRFERHDFSLIASVVTTHGSIELVGNRRAGVSNASQLAGKRVGVRAGTGSAYYLDLQLAQAGVDSATVKAVPLPLNRMAAALGDGQVDAVSTWEPYTHQAMQALGKDAQRMTDAGTYLDSSNLIAAQRLVGVSDAALVAVLRAIDRAEAFILTEPAAAQAIMRRRMQVDQAFVDRVWPTMRFRLSLDQSLLATFEAEARWARREGHATGDALPNFLDLIHAAPLKIVKPGAVGVGR